MSKEWKQKSGIPYTVRQLPSGWWAVFYGDIWIDAASLTRKQAEEKLRKLLEYKTDGAFHEH